MWRCVLTLALLVAITVAEKCGPCVCQGIAGENGVEESGLLLNCTGVRTPGGALPSPALATGAPWLEEALEGVSLVQLELRGCGAERLLPIPALGSPLRTLDLSSNAITQLMDAVFHAHREALQALTIDDNRLEELNVDALVELRGLRVLRVERNKLKELPLGAVPSGLLKLFVAGNAIAEIRPPTSFSQQMQLQELDVSDNTLTKLSPEAMLALGALPELSVLRLAGNPLHALDGGAALTRSLPRLRILDVSRCGLPALQLGAKQHTALQVLLASNNALPSTEATSILRVFPSLQNLQLGHNVISEFPVTNAHAALQVLNLTQNSLKSLPEILPTLPVLRELDLSGNELSEVPPGALGAPALPALQGLWLDRNEPLATLRLTAPLPNLRTLSAGSLPRLRQIGADAFVGLRAPLRDVPGGNASAACQPTENGSLPGLSLRLAGNMQLTDIATDALKGLPLCELDLSAAALTTLNEGLAPWERLRAVDLQRNPWDCQCELQWLIDRVVKPMYERGNSQLLYELRCETPAGLRDRRLVHFYDWPKALCSVETMERLLESPAERGYSLSAGNGMLIALVSVGVIFLGTVIVGLTMHYQSLKRKRRLNRRV